MTKLLTLKETAELLNLKVSTIYAWVHKRKIPYVKLGGKLAFIEDQIKEFINSRNIQPE